MCGTATEKPGKTTIDYLDISTACGDEQVRSHPTLSTTSQNTHFPLSCRLVP